MKRSRPSKRKRQAVRNNARWHEDDVAAVETEPCPDCLERGDLNAVGLPRMIGSGALRGGTRRVRGRVSASHATPFATAPGVKRTGCETCGGSGRVPIKRRSA